MIFKRKPHASAITLHNLKWHLSTTAEALSDIRAKHWPPSVPSCQCCQALRHCQNQPISKVGHTFLVIQFLCKLPTAAVPVISGRSVGEGFHCSKWGLKTRSEA